MERTNLDRAKGALMDAASAIEEVEMYLNQINKPEKVEKRGSQTSLGDNMEIDFGFGVLRYQTSSLRVQEIMDALKFVHTGSKLD